MKLPLTVLRHEPSSPTGRALLEAYPTLKIQVQPTPKSPVCLSRLSYVRVATIGTPTTECSGR